MGAICCDAKQARLQNRSGFEGFCGGPFRLKELMNTRSKLLLGRRREVFMLPAKVAGFEHNLKGDFHPGLPPKNGTENFVTTDHFTQRIAQTADIKRAMESYQADRARRKAQHFLVNRPSEFLLW